MRNIFTWLIFAENAVCATRRLEAHKILEKSFQHVGGYKLLPRCADLSSYVSQKGDLPPFSAVLTGNYSIVVTDFLRCRSKMFV